MPSPYTPSPTATQSPSAAPGPGVVPTVELPIDTDPPNGATFAQAFKVLGDFIAWLVDKFAIAGSMAQRIERWRNAKLQTRALISHAGFVEGKIMSWRECWETDSVPAKSAVGFGSWFGRWSYTIAGDAAGGLISGNFANVGPPTFGGGPTGTDPDMRTRNIFLATNPAGTAGSAQHVEATGQIILDADTCLTMQWDAKIHTISGNSDDAMGFITTSLQNAGGTTESNAPFGAWFEKVPGTGTWLCFWQGASGGVVSLNSGVTATGRQRFRIEVYGANSSDNSAHRVIFYINGTLITDQNVDFTAAAPGAGTAVAAPFFRHYATAELTWMNVQIADFNANTWPGDVAF